MKKLLGHTFVPFTEQDWMAFSGAEEGSLICYCGDGKTILILDPDGSVTEFRDELEVTVRWNPDQLS